MLWLLSSIMWSLSSTLSSRAPSPWACCFVFVNMAPYGSQNFKTLLLHQITFESFFWDFVSVVLTNVLGWIFETLSFWFFRNRFLFLLTWDPMEAKISKYYSPLKSLLNLFNFFLNFLVSSPHKSTVLDFWTFEFPIFNEFLNFPIIPYGGSKNLNYLENEPS